MTVGRSRRLEAKAVYLAGRIPDEQLPAFGRRLVLGVLCPNPASVPAACAVAVALAGNPWMAGCAAAVTVLACGPAGSVACAIALTFLTGGHAAPFWAIAAARTIVLLPSIRRKTRGMTPDRETEREIRLIASEAGTIGRWLTLRRFLPETADPPARARRLLALCAMAVWTCACIAPHDGTTPLQTAAQWLPGTLALLFTSEQSKHKP